MTLTLMFRSYCHLCHDMQARLETLQAELGFDLTVVDVDTDSELEEKYNESVPVLLHADHEICHWYLDEMALRAYLAKLG